MILTAEALANKLDFYASSGCFSDGSLNVECIESLENADEVPEVIGISDELEKTAQNFAERTAASVMLGARTMLENAKAFVAAEGANE